MSRKIEVEIGYENPDSQAVIVTINTIPGYKLWNQVSETRGYESPEKLVSSVGREHVLRRAQSFVGLLGGLAGPIYTIFDLSQAPLATPEHIGGAIVVGVTTFLTGSYTATRGFLGRPIAEAILSEAKRSITQRWELKKPVES